MLKTGDLVRHYKGDLYVVMSVSPDTETRVERVTYVNMHDKKQYNRELSMFIEKVPVIDIHNPELDTLIEIPRFEVVDNISILLEDGLIKFGLSTSYQKLLTHIIPNNKNLLGVRNKETNENHILVYVSPDATECIMLKVTEDSTPLKMSFVILKFKTEYLLRDFELCEDGINNRKYIDSIMNDVRKNVIDKIEWRKERYILPEDARLVMDKDIMIDTLNLMVSILNASIYKINPMSYDKYMNRIGTFIADNDIDPSLIAPFTITHEVNDVEIPYMFKDFMYDYINMRGNKTDFDNMVKSGNSFMWCFSHFVMLDHSVVDYFNAALDDAFDALNQYK